MEINIFTEDVIDHLNDKFRHGHLDKNLKGELRIFRSTLEAKQPNIGIAVIAFGWNAYPEVDKTDIAVNLVGKKYSEIFECLMDYLSVKIDADYKKVLH